MHRRDFLKKTAKVAIGSAFLLGLDNTYGIETEAERPNILWIIADDICPDIGCYGNETVSTPNIDSLAEEGILYTNAFTSSPICSPSRSGFMTGMYQTSINAHNHRSRRDDSLPVPVELLTDHFRRAGYFTSNCSGIDWDKPGKKDLNFDIWSGPREPFDGTDWRERKPGQPFYAQVNFYEPHRPFVRDFDNPVDPDKVELPPYYPDHPIVRNDWAIYLECIQVLDRKVGKVLERLEADGLADNTIVVFFGDNGRPFPRGKQFLYEGGIHVPLIVKWPGHLEKDKISDELISAIDIGPTSLNLAGIQPPDYMQGQPFLGPDSKRRDYVFAARDRCNEALDRIRAVRTRRFKYIRNFYPERPYLQFHGYMVREHPEATLLKVLYEQDKLNKDQRRFLAAFKPEEELYDLENDPHEVNNLAYEPDYQQKRRQLSKVLEDWIEISNDQGRIPESPEKIAEIKKAKNQKHAEWMKKRGLSPDISRRDYLRWWKDQLKPTEKVKDKKI